jgi:hypothetical protein
MTQRDQIRSSLSGHDSREPRSLERISFRRTMLAQCHDSFFTHQNSSRRNCTSLRDLFHPRVDHANAALLVDVRKVRKLCHREK